MLKKDLPTGIILYKGPSLIDGGPIVAIANAFRRSENKKTGTMIQVWIIREDKHPAECILDRSDFSICGDCKHRAKEIDGKRAKGGSCYVNLMYGPFAIYHAYKRGTYQPFELPHLRLFKGRHVRLGAYGDPAAVPIEVWEAICSVAAGWTGYTHQWRTCDQSLARFCMASVDTPTEYREAKHMLWRTFRVRLTKTAKLAPNEMVCPASDEAGNKTDCEHCSGCSGTRSNRKDVAIVVHGWKGKVKNFKRTIANLPEPQNMARISAVV